MILKLFKYLITGSINFVVWFFVIWLMARMGFGYMTYTACAYIIAMILSFFLNLYFTFSVRGYLIKRMTLFFSFNLFNLLCIEIVQYWLIEFLKFNHDIAILTGMILYTLTGFFMNYYVVYRHQQAIDTNLQHPQEEPSTVKKLYICADDYAQNASVSEGILRLLEEKRINASSCLVNSPSWEYWGKRLLPIASSTWIGLHLNLTFGEALSTGWREYYGASFKKLPWLITRAYTRRLCPARIKMEIESQIQRFINVMGFFPHFIDGHEHIHQLPMIRDMLLDVITSHRPTILPDDPLDKCCPFFCRTTAHHWTACFSFKSFPKRALIACLGGLVLNKRLSPLHIKTNTSFSGIYNFSDAQTYRRHFQQFLQESKTGGLIMCHPGLASQDVQDPLYQTRILEMNYFLSEDYQMDLQAEKARLSTRCEDPIS